jgi:hypothetical protein
MYIRDSSAAAAPENMQQESSFENQKYSSASPSLLSIDYPSVQYGVVE